MCSLSERSRNRLSFLLVSIFPGMVTFNDERRVLTSQPQRIRIETQRGQPRPAHRTGSGARAGEALGRAGGGRPPQHTRGAGGGGSSVPASGRRASLRRGPGAMYGL